MKIHEYHESQVPGVASGVVAGLALRRYRGNRAHRAHRGHRDEMCCHDCRLRWKPRRGVSSPMHWRHIGKVMC